MPLRSTLLSRSKKGRVGQVAESRSCLVLVEVEEVRLQNRVVAEVEPHRSKFRLQERAASAPGRL